MESVAAGKEDKTLRSAAAVVYGLSAALVGYVVAFVLPVLYGRLTFPGVLEHQESTTIFLMNRMAESLGNLYQMPALHTGSVIYNPAYYFYLWVLHPLVGYSAPAIRIASVAPPLLASAAVIELLGRKQMGLRWLGIAWAFVSLAVYPLYTWIDLARLEAMLFLSIVLVWLTLCLDDAWRPKFILVGLAVAFSFAVKQPGALFAAAPLVLALTERRYLISVAVAAGAIALFTSAMFWCYGDPYLHWAFREPGSNPFSIFDLAQHLREMVAVAPIILFGPLFLFVRGLEPKSAAGKLLIVTALTFAIASLGAGKFGGWVTQYVILLFMATIPTAAFILRGLRTQDSAIMRASLVHLLLIAYSITMIETRGDRQTVRPQRLDRQRQNALLEVVRSVPGDTWVTTWPHINLWAEHTPVSGIGFLDWHKPATDETEAAIRNRRFDLIVLSPEMVTHFDEIVRENYIFCFSLPMQNFGARLFLPTEVWARSEEECEHASRALLE